MDAETVAAGRDALKLIAVTVQHHRLALPADAEEAIASIACDRSAQSAAIGRDTRFARHLAAARPGYRERVERAAMALLSDLIAPAR